MKPFRTTAAALLGLALIGGGCPTFTRKTQAPAPPAGTPTETTTGAAALRTERYEAGDANTESPRCHFTFAYPVVEGSGPVVDSLNREIRLAFGLESTTPTQSVRTAKEIGDAFVADCRAELADLMKELGSDAGDTFTYESDTDFRPILNRRGLLSLEISTYDYAGGAHGNPGLASLNLDLQTGKRLLLGDVVKTDGLRPLMQKVRKAFVEQYSDAMFEESRDEYLAFVEGRSSITDRALSLEGSFYLTDDSFVFFTNVYEIAPYVAGPLSIELPYSEAAPYLIENGPLSRLIQ